MNNKKYEEEERRKKQKEEERAKKKKAARILRPSTAFVRAMTWGGRRRVESGAPGARKEQSEKQKLAAGVRFP